MSSTTESTNTIKIFLSYAQEDVEFRDRLEKHLSIFRRQGQNLSWHDREIRSDREWVHEIDAELNTAQIILLLVSPDFMDSEYCFGVEVKRALGRHETGEAYVIPVILRPVYWENAPFSKLQVLPTGGEPVTRWPDRDKAFFDIARGIQNVVEGLPASNKNTEGDAQYKDKRYEEALAAYEQAIQLNPRSAHAYNGKGNVLYDLKRYEEALAAYEQAIQLNTKDASAYYNKGNALCKLRSYEEALVAYEQAILLDPNKKGIDTTVDLQGLLLRIESVQHFLMKNGFDIEFVPKQTGFIAIPRTTIWRERFPRGLYVRVLFDTLFDQHTVQSIYHAIKTYSDHALIVFDRQPEISGWMAIGGLRVQEKDRFVFLPIEETLIKESIAVNKEAQTFSFYINKRLGQDFDPYDVRDPVSDAVNFFGRESLTDEILNALRLGQRLGLFGLHKMGKSSVLQRLSKKSEFPVAYVYLATGDGLSGIYKRILSGWSIDM